MERRKDHSDGKSGQQVKEEQPMPMDLKRYPKNWKEIAFEIKQKAGWRCEVCGKQCRRPGEPFDTHKRTLTVAHLNHTPEDVRPENLKAMCAPCHLKNDAQHHAETRKARRRKTCTK